MRQNNSLSYRLFPGIIALIIYLIYFVSKNSINDFYPWLGETLIVYAAWFFLLKVIVNTLLIGHFNRKFELPMLLGIFALLFAFFFFNMTIEDLFISLLEATIILSFVNTLYGEVREKVIKYG